jgi:hypothetical protein
MSYTSLTCVPRARRMGNDDCRSTMSIHGPCRSSRAAYVAPTQNFTDVAVTKDSADPMNEDWLVIAHEKSGTLGALEGSSIFLPRSCVKGSGWRRGTRVSVESMEDGAL